MHKYWVAAFILIIFISGAYARTLYERSFSDFGYENMEAASYRCNEYILAMPDLNGFFYLTILARFIPENTGNASIESHFNGYNLGTLYADEFDCQTNKEFCVAHLPVKRPFIRAENKLKICLRPSKSIVKIVLSNRSKIGAYAQGIFNAQNFRKCVVFGNRCLEKYRAVVGEDLNVRISARNSGNETTNVTIEAVRPVVEETEIRKEIGKIKFNAAIRPQEEKMFYHIVRVGKLTRFNLPPAALYYTDAFGRKHLVFSNTVTIFPKKHPDVSAMLFVKDVNREAIKFNVVLTNSSGIEIKDAMVELVGNIKGMKKVLTIRPRSFATATFTLGRKTGLQVKCLVEIPEYNMHVACNTIELTEGEKNIMPIIAASVLLIALAAVVFLYLNSRSE